MDRGFSFIDGLVATAQKASMHQSAKEPQKQRSKMGKKRKA
jgi:hypothetical protein